MTAVGIFGLGNFAPAFFTLRASEMLRPELAPPAATTAAVGFYLGLHAVGAAVAFPGGWLGDRFGRTSVLVAAYLVFAAACAVAAFVPPVATCRAWAFAA